jgi:DNA-binding NarL/FixJ family response regulator
MKDAVERILGPTFAITRVSDGEELLEAVASSRPDVMIVDISMPKLSGIDALKRLRGEGTRLPPTVVCSMHREPGVLEEALRAGARAYVYKARAASELQQAVKAALEDRQFISPEVAPNGTVQNGTIAAGALRSPPAKPGSANDDPPQPRSPNPKRDAS